MTFNLATPKLQHESVFKVFCLVYLMSFRSVNMRTVWLKCWAEEPAHKKHLICMTFEGRHRFGATLDALIKDATRGKRTNLPQQKKSKAQSAKTHHLTESKKCSLRSSVLSTSKSKPTPMTQFTCKSWTSKSPKLPSGKSSLECGFVPTFHTGRMSDNL